MPVDVLPERAALFEAAVSSLAVHGYRDTSVAGAQGEAKAKLATEAVVHLAQRRACELRRSWEPPPPGRKRIEGALDALWMSHSGDLLTAAVELWIAGRDDAELGARVTRAARNFDRVAVRYCRRLFGLRSDAYDGAVELVLAAIRGILLAGRLGERDRDELDPQWRACRTHLADLFTIERNTST